MDEEVDESTGNTVSNGLNVKVSTSENYQYVRVEVKPTADPASGDLKIVFTSDRRR